MITYLSFFRPETVGNPVIVREENIDGHIVWSLGSIIKVHDAFVETEHKRDRVKYPNMGDKAYYQLFIKHYYQL